MNFDDWEPVYELLLADFGYDRSTDERARDVLAGLTTPFDPDRLTWLRGATVAVAGAGPSITDPDDVDRAAAADRVVAASTAADRLREAGVGVDLMVTDLDKNPGTAVELSREGVPVAIHAHGDNLPALREWVPECAPEYVLPTTQTAPSGPVVNYGGFTDGDRAAFLADAFDAATLRFVGWDFDDPTVGAEKRKKLAWAERLLRWLERRRGDRFDLFAGERESGGSE